MQLAAVLRLSGIHSVDLFMDDAPHLWRRTINGEPTQPPQLLRDWASYIDQVLLVIYSLSRSRRRRLVADLQELGIPLLQAPSVDDNTGGRARIDALRPIAIEELFGLGAVPPNPDLLGPVIAGACVFVTGAGGLIGS